MLAQSIEDKLGDGGWVQSLFRRTLQLCRNVWEFASLVSAVARSRYCSTRLLSHIRERAQAVIVDPEDLNRFEEIIVQHDRGADTKEVGVETGKAAEARASIGRYWTKSHLLRPVLLE